METEGVTPRGSSERGATATEYALLCGFIAMVIVFGIGIFGTALDAFYGQMTVGVRSALGLP